MIFYSLVDFWKASTKYLSEAGRNSHQQYYSDLQTENEKYQMKNIIKKYNKMHQTLHYRRNEEFDAFYFIF